MTGEGAAFDLLRAWGWDEGWARLAEVASAEQVPARVVAQHRGELRLVAATGELTGVAPGRLLYRATGQRALPAVGDWVLVEPALDGPAVVDEILPRRTEFVRRKPGTEDQEQVVAANVDTAFLVTSANQEFSPRRLERYLVATRDAGAEPVVVLSKIDLARETAPLLAAVRAAAADAPVLPVSARTGEGLEALGAWLRPGDTVALLGSSGVGKSTLLNVLAGREVMRTGRVRASDDRGRHTTTHRQIFRLPCGALLLDTPGMRELGLWGADEGLEETFEDVAEFVARCRFRDCTHEHEPGCAVRAALADGTLSHARWQSYRKLQREAAHEAPRSDRAAAAAERRRWKLIHKQLRPGPKKGR